MTGSTSAEGDDLGAFMTLQPPKHGQLSNL